MLEYILLALLMFFTGMVVDVIWALYVKYIAIGNRLRASIYSVISGICTIVFLNGFEISNWISLFWLLGLFTGTYYSNQIESFIMDRKKVWKSKYKRYHTKIRF